MKQSFFAFDSIIRFNKITTLIALGLFVVSIVLFGYRLGWGSLEPWDEAWYATAARGVVAGQLLSPNTFGWRFYDHPPLGSWIIAASTLLLGESEFSVRLPMALFGAGAVVLVFLIGRKVHSTRAGLMAAMVLLSSRWFVLRARTGNLDALLVFTQLAVLYFTVSANNQRQLVRGYWSLTASLLTKSLISLTLLPLLISKHMLLVVKSKKIEKKAVVFSVLAILLSISWYLWILFFHGIGALEKVVFEILLRRDSTGFSVSQLLTNIHSIQPLVHNWYKVFGICLLFLIIFARRPKIGWFLFYSVLISTPFLVSSKTMIWHMIPMIPVIGLTIGLSLSLFTDQLLVLIKRHLTKKHLPFLLLKLIPVLIIALIAVVTYWQLLPEIYRANPTVSDQQVLGEKVKDLPGRLLLEAYNDLFTSAGYYAHKDITILWVDSSEQLLSEPRPFVAYIRDDSPLLEQVSECEKVAKSGIGIAFYCP